MRKNSSHAQPDLTCQEFVELVTDYLENAVSPDVRERLEAHLEICDGCKLYLGQMRLTVRALHREPESQLPSALRQKILQRLSGEGPDTRQ